MSSNTQTTQQLHRLLTLLFELNDRYMQNRPPLRLKQYANEKYIPIRTVQRDMALLMTFSDNIVKENNTYKLKESLNVKSLDLVSHALLDLTKELVSPFDDDFIKTLLSYTGVKDNPFFIKMPHVHPDRISYAGLRIKDLEKAIIQSRRIVVDYSPRIKQKDGRLIPTKDINFAPLKICFHQGFWYLIGFADNATEEILKLRMDLIKDIRFPENFENFSYKKDINQILKESVNMWFETAVYPIKIILSIRQEASAYFEKKDFFPNQRILKKDHSGALRISCTASSQQEIFPILLSWLPKISIIEPTSWAKKFRKILEEFLQSSEI